MLARLKNWFFSTTAKHATRARGNRRQTLQPLAAVVNVLESRVLLTAQAATFNFQAIASQLNTSETLFNTTENPFTQLNWGTVTMEAVPGFPLSLTAAGGIPAKFTIGFGSLNPTDSPTLSLTTFDNGLGDGVAKQFFTNTTGDVNTLTLYLSGQPVATGTLDSLTVLTNTSLVSTGTGQFTFTASAGSDPTVFNEIKSVTGGTGQLPFGLGTFSFAGAPIGFGTGASLFASNGSFNLQAAVDAPTSVGLSNSSVAEHSPIGTVVGALSATDSGAGSTFTYSLVTGAASNDNSDFSIDSNGNLTTSAILDFTTQSSYTVFVQASDQNSQVFDQQFTITLTQVIAAPTVTTNPASQIIPSGQPVTFTAAAFGDPIPTVQWQVSTDGGATFTDISGATSTTLSFTAMAAFLGNEYQAVFTNSQGTATTSTATLTVTAALTAPVVTTDPTSQIIIAGQPVTFTAAATGNPTPTVQWQVSTDGGATFADISGETSTTLSFTTTAALTGNEYQAVFTNSQGTATTAAATLTVLSAPVVTLDPTSQSILAGQPVTFTAAVSGNPAPTVQWQVSTDGGATFADVTGATSTTLIFTAMVGLNGNEYQAVFTNSQGTATTAAATLTVLSAPVVTLDPTSQSIPAGQPVTFTANATGNPAPTVQWLVSTDGGATYADISGATSTTLNFTATAAMTGNEYLALFTNSQGTASTAVATLTVLTAPVVTLDPISQSIPAGQPVTFTANATGNPTPTVQWQVSTDGGATFTDIPEATSTTLSFTATASATGNEYLAVFTNSQGTASTAAATLTVLTAPVVTLDPISQSIPAGQPVTFTTNATGNPTPTVQWQVSTDGGATFADISGATSTTLNVTTSAGLNMSAAGLSTTITGVNGNEYLAVFTNSQGTASTTIATLTVLTAPVVTVNPTNRGILNGNQVTFIAAANGNPTPMVQWQVSTDAGATFTDLSGATSTTLSFVATIAMKGNQYRAVFTNSQGTAFTSGAILAVLALPVVTTNPTSQTIPLGQPVTFTAAGTGIPSPTVQWQVSTNGGSSFSNIQGATSTTLSFTTTVAVAGNQYRAVFTNVLGSATTVAATLTVPTGPVAPRIIAPTLLNVNQNSSLSFMGQVFVLDLSGTAERLTLSVSHGKLSLGTMMTFGTMSALGTTTGVKVTGNGTSTLTITGSLNSINQDLFSLIYTPTIGYHGSDTLKLSDTDTTDHLTGTASVAIMVSPLPPTIKAPASVTVKQGGSLTFVAANAISITDPGGSEERLIIKVGQGTLTLSPNTRITVIGNGTSTVTITGALTFVQAALRGLKYMPASGYAGPDTLSLMDTDTSNNLMAMANVNINVTGNIVLM